MSHPEPKSTAEMLAAALAQHQKGNHAAAEPLYRAVLQQDPRSAEGWHLLGALCLQTGRAAEAVEAIGRAISIDHRKPDYYFHLGAAYSSLGQHDEAIATIRRGVQLAPRLATGHYNLGTALATAKRHAEAVASFRHAVAADPNSAEAHYNLANSLSSLKKYAEAETSYRDAIRLRPGYRKALVNLANTLRAMQRLPDAVEVLRETVAYHPSYATAQANLGLTLIDTRQFAEALQVLKKAVEVDSKLATSHHYLGMAYQSLAEHGKAAECFERALELDPELPDAHFGRATMRLLHGDLAGGFAEYESRWKCSGFSVRPLNRPRWDGGRLDGKTVFLYAEQGLGDTLHFVRYARIAKELGGRVIVECQPPLVQLLSLLPSIDTVIPLGAPLPPFDMHAPLMSLPGIVPLPPEATYREPYLVAAPELVDKWRERLAELEGVRVGLCWYGNPKNLFNDQRSFPLVNCEKLAKVPDISFVSLQKGDGAAEIPRVSLKPLTPGPSPSRGEGSLSIHDLGSDWDEATGPFMDSAAVIKILDLVITCDTAMAHLAGGLGAEVWLALSAGCDWRWMLNREDTPWYPTMRLFRQSRLNQWDDVFEGINGALQTFSRTRGERPSAPRLRLEEGT